MSGDPERWFFVHLQKTGGTALFQRLRSAMGDEAVYPLPEDHGRVEAVIDTAHLRATFAAHRAQIRVVTGHFPLCMANALGASFQTFTVLRHPVERTLSALRRRQVFDEQYRDLDLTTIYDDLTLRPVIQDHMVKMLSLSLDEMAPIPLTQAVPLGRGHLDRAKENLDTVDVVGLQEEFDAFCAELEERYSWDLGEPRMANRTRPQPVPESLKDRIAADNQLDLELYEHASELVASRRTREATSGG